MKDSWSCAKKASWSDAGQDEATMTRHYDERFRRLSNRIEKSILAGIIVCALILLTGELLLQYGPVRDILVETQRLEGVSRVP